MPSASSTLLFFASLLAVQARVVPDACPASCSDVSTYGVEHHRLQDLSHCGKGIHYNEVYNIKNGELVHEEISVCSSDDAAPVDQKRNVNNDRSKPVEHLIDFHVSSKSSGNPLPAWEVAHLSDSIAGDIAELSKDHNDYPYQLEALLTPGNTSMGIYAGKLVDAASLTEAIRGWGKQFVNGSSTFVGQYCGMGKDRTIGFAFDGHGRNAGVVAGYIKKWAKDQCVFDFEEAHVWQDVPVTFKNDIWQAVADPGY